MVRFETLCIAAFVLMPGLASADHGVGTLIKLRATEVQGRLAQIFAPAAPNQKLFAGDGVRTLRRGFADIKFADSSEIRLNERTDMVIEDSNTMRRYALAEGAIWVRVAKGVRTVVRTPVGTATARGTVFTMTADGVLTVLEGTVQFDAGSGTMMVHAGESIKFSPQQNTFTPANDTFTMVDPATGLTSNGWFDNLGSTPYLDPNGVPEIDTLTREYVLYGDDTVGGFATPLEVLEGGAIFGTAIEASAHLFPGPRPVPEPPLWLLVLPGASAIGLRLRKRR